MRQVFPFQIRHSDDGREQIWYADDYGDRVAKIRVQIFGEAPPMGHSISMEPLRMARTGAIVS